MGLRFLSNSGRYVYAPPCTGRRALGGASHCTTALPDAPQPQGPGSPTTAVPIGLEARENPPFTLH